MAPQNLGLFQGKLEHEIFWEPIPITLDRTVESFGLYSIELG